MPAFLNQFNFVKLALVESTYVNDLESVGFMSAQPFGPSYAYVLKNGRVYFHRCNCTYCTYVQTRGAANRRLNRSGPRNFGLTLVLSLVYRDSFQDGGS